MRSYNHHEKWPCVLEQRAYHILSTQDSTFKDPSHLLASHPGIERIERNDVGTGAVERLAVNFEMPLITGCDTARLDVFLGIRRLHECDRAETSLGHEASGMAVLQMKRGCNVVQFWGTEIMREPSLGLSLGDPERGRDECRRVGGRRDGLHLHWSSI